MCIYKLHIYVCMHASMYVCMYVCGQISRIELSIFRKGKGNSGIDESTFGNTGKLVQEFSEHIAMHFYAPTKCM